MEKSIARRQQEGIRWTGITNYIGGVSHMYPPHRQDDQKVFEREVPSV